MIRWSRIFYIQSALIAAVGLYVAAVEHDSARGLMLGGCALGCWLCGTLHEAVKL